MTKKPIRILLLVVLFFAFASAGQIVRGDPTNQLPQHNHLVGSNSEEGSSGGASGQVLAKGGIYSSNSSGDEASPVGNYPAKADINSLVLGTLIFYLIEALV